MKIQHWDPQAEALSAFWSGDTKAQLTIRTVLGTTDIPASIYFRSLDDMPMAELYALELCKGQVLEIGAGAGSHALALQSMGIPVTALDIHPTMGKIMQDRGVNQVVIGDCWAYEPAHPFDTLLLMMNGIGFVSYVHRIAPFLEKSREWLAPGGQILLDSTDLSINVPGIAHKNPSPDYWGEMTYELGFRGQFAEPLTWLYLAPDLLKQEANAAGWHMQVIYEGDDGHYLARLTMQ